jgi:hypothetical protein
VWDYSLTRLKTELLAIKLHRDYIRFGRHQAGDPANFGIGLTIRPGRQVCATDVVVAAKSLVRAKGLMFHEGQHRLIDVGAQNVPAWRKTGLVQDYGPFRIGDDAVLMTNHEVARRLADIDSVVTIGGVTQDPCSSSS